MTRTTFIRPALACAAVAMLLLAAGCSSTHERTVSIVQSQPTTRPTRPFVVDTSALPDWAVRHHTSTDGGDAHTDVTIDSGVPVRVIVVPATQASR